MSQVKIGFKIKQKGREDENYTKSVVFETFLDFECEFSNVLLVSGLEFCAVGKVNVPSAFQGLLEFLCLLCVLLVLVLVGLLFHC